MRAYDKLGIGSVTMNWLSQRFVAFKGEFSQHVRHETDQHCNTHQLRKT